MENVNCFSGLFFTYNYLSAADFAPFFDYNNTINIKIVATSFIKPMQPFAIIFINYAKIILAVIV